MYPTHKVSLVACLPLGTCGRTIYLAELCSIPPRCKFLWTSDKLRSTFNVAWEHLEKKPKKKKRKENGVFMFRISALRRVMLIKVQEKTHIKWHCTTFYKTQKLKLIKQFL